jgi:prepilin-type N-terminal cleavage/methylation domain-containing protein
MLNPKSQANQGFTLTEVLVALLITTLFIATAMQAMVFAAVFRVKAKQNAQAITWIQQDLEAVKYKATEGPTPNQLPYDSTKCGTYGTYLRDNLPPLSDGGTTIIAGKTFTLSRSPSPNGNVLQLTYSVVPEGGSLIANLYTEVLPDAAFKCL